jgi:hypothetical protein
MRDGRELEEDGAALEGGGRWLRRRAWLLAA